MGLSGHAEMDAQPAPNVFASPDYFGVVTGEFEEHLLSTPGRSQQLLADEVFSKQVSVRAAEDIFTRVEGKIDNLLAAAGIPLFAIPLDFGQLGHRADYAKQLGRQLRVENYAYLALRAGVAHCGRPPTLIPKTRAAYVLLSLRERVGVRASMALPTCAVC